MIIMNNSSPTGVDLISAATPQFRQNIALMSFRSLTCHTSTRMLPRDTKIETSGKKSHFNPPLPTPVRSSGLSVHS